MTTITRRGVMARAVIAGLAAMLVVAPVAASEGPPYSFPPAVFDIDAAPDGSILVAGADGSIYAARGGAAQPVASVPVPTTVPIPSTLNGIASIGRGNYFATTGGGDLAAGAKLWRVSPGDGRMVADIEAFEIARDPDGTAGLAWKDPACEAIAPFSAGPQSNPYHLAALSGSTALVADAAGNSLLAAASNGVIEVVATFTPPIAGGGSSQDPGDWMVLSPLDADTDCYVQPVPTSVAIGPDGAYYVGELTGVTPADIGFGGPSTGLSRVWRIEPGARNVVCPSERCEMAFSGFTSAIDVAFGPDGNLYVVEYDENNWFAATVLAAPGGGTVNRCDLGTGDCVMVAGELTLPGAITFDERGRLWLLESNTVAPTLRTLATP